MYDDNPSAESIYIPVHNGSTMRENWDRDNDEFIEKELDIDNKTGKLTKEHMDECGGCSLCQP